MNGYVKFFGGGLVLMLAIAAMFMISIRSCLSEYDERFALAPAAYVEKDGKAVLFSIVQFQQTDSYEESGGGMVQRSVTDKFYVQTNDAQTGKKIASVPVKFDPEIRQFPREVIGQTRTAVWIFFDGLRAYDAFTLEQVASVEIIENKNPVLKGQLPAERNFYEFNKSDNALLFITKDGAPWSLNLKTFIASPVPALKEKTAEEKEEIVKVKERNKMNIHFNQTKINQDTLNRNWFGIYSSEEFNTLPERVTVAALNGNNQRRQLIAATYDSVNDYQQFVIKKDKTIVLKNAGYFLDGGFLMDKNTGSFFHLSSPVSTLLVSKDEVGIEGEIVVSRVGLDGSMLWEYNTGMKEWIDWKQYGNNLYIYGNNRKRLSSGQCSLILLVNLGDGSTKVYDYLEEKVKE